MKNDEKKEHVIEVEVKFTVSVRGVSRRDCATDLAAKLKARQDEIQDSVIAILMKE